MNRFKFTLGRKPDTSTNLITNGDFSSGLTGWTNSGGFSVVSGRAEITDAGTLKQTAILTEGATYQLSFGLKNAATPGSKPGRLNFQIGDTYYNQRKNYAINNSSTNVTLTYKNLLCSFGTNFGFYTNVGWDCSIDNVVLYKEVWNDAIVDEPFGVDDMEIVKRKDEAINGLIYEYVSGLTFIGDGYNFIIDYISENGFCGEIPILIEEWDSNILSYKIFYEGVIFVKNSKIDYIKREIEVEIEQKNSALSFIENKDIPVNPFHETDIAPSPVVYIDFNNSAGSYPATPDWEDQTCYNVYTLLRRIVMVSSDYRFDFDSTFFSSGTFENFCTAPIGVLYTANVNPLALKLSFNELYTELNKLFALSFYVDRSGIIPKIIIEPSIDLYDGVPVITVTNPSEINAYFDIDRIYKTINIGYSRVDANATGTSNDKEKGSTYFNQERCSTGELSLVSGIIQSTDVIRNHILGTITDNKYAKYFFWIETDGTKTINSGSGSYVYNINIDEEDNLSRHLEILKSSFVKDEEGVLSIVEKTNTPLAMILELKYPLQRSEYDLIEQAFNSIQVDSINQDLTGRVCYILESKYRVKDGLTEFKLLTTT